MWSIFMQPGPAVLKQILSCFQQILFSFGVADALISFILKFYPLSSVNFLYWEANLPTNRVNLSRVNFKYVNQHER